MALLVKDIKLPLNEKESLLSKVTAKTLGIPGNAVKGLAIKRISLDARKKNDICFIYTVEISLEPRDERRILKRGLPTVCEAEAREIREVATGSIPLDKPIIVVGMGPGGLFAAYTLAKHGYKPIVIERGEPIERRTRREAQGGQQPHVRRRRGRGVFGRQAYHTHKGQPCSRRDRHTCGSWSAERDTPACKAAHRHGYTGQSGEKHTRGYSAHGRRCEVFC
jgi:hypothetical protein